MKPSSQHRAAAPRRGFALLTVLMVLLALLVLCAPFLMTARNTSKAGTQLADRAQARLALDSALRNARSRLGASHPAVDRTPYYDDLEELYEVEPLDPEFFDARNDRGVMFDAQIEDVAARIDLNSAPPQMFANLLGLTTRTVEPLKAGDTEMVVTSTFGFPPVGFVWLNDELIGYSELEPQKFKKLVRGIGGRTDSEGSAVPCGPQPATDHPLNSLAIEQRAFAPVLWRNYGLDGGVRAFDAPEQLRDCVQLAFGVEAAADWAAEQRYEENEKLDLEALRIEERRLAAENYIEPFLRFGSTYAGVRGGRVWQRPVRVLNPVEAGKTCRLEVDETRWFAPGTTVRITDGQTTEIAIVQRVQNDAVFLMDALQHDYFVGMAQLQPQARRPINVNTASADVLELVFSNLQVRGINDRITRDEARALAEVVIESRPFEGFEDFVRRIVLPAAGLEPLPKDAPVVPDALAQGGTLIDPWDAIALHANALNSNDTLLAYGTMPLAFTTRDVFRMTLRSVVNASSGVERATALREQVELVTPQRELMQLWARQEDFDEAARLDLDAPWWTTGPSATARRDGFFPRVNLGPGTQGTAAPPSRLLAHLGVHAQMLYGGGAAAPSASSPNAAPIDPTTLPYGSPVSASRDENGWAALWPSRAPDSIGTPVRNVMHFDHETRDPEGRFLPDETIVKDVSGPDVQWADPNGQPSLLAAFNYSMWFKPRDLSTGQTLLDVGRSSVETDRVQLYFDGADLVLRVLDGAGDHRDTPGFVEAGEARFSLTQNGNSPGLAPDTWSHVAIDVRGTRPSQISMLVDGRALGVRTPGLSRLAAPLTDTATTITVENGEGFGAINAPVVLRIGNELIEAVRTGQNTFDASWGAGGNFGFGGRLARVPFDIASAPSALGAAETNILQTTQTTHAQGTPVELYGYATAVQSNIPSGAASLNQTLGVWAPGRVTSVVGGQTAQGDIIQATNLFTPFGLGLEGASAAQQLVVEPADTGMTGEQLASAFHATGGYAALIQKQVQTAQETDPTGGPGSTTNLPTTQSGSRIGDLEVIYYSSAAPNGTGVTLTIQRRAALRANESTVQPHAFVVQWAPNWANGAQVPLSTLLDWQTFVAPISIPVLGAAGVAGFPLPRPDESEFAQLGGVGAPVENTEWLRYDDVQSNHLVRHDRFALERLRDALTLAGLDVDIRGTIPPNPPIVGPATNFAAPTRSAATTLAAPPASPSQAQTGLTNWQAFWGVSEDDAWPVTKAARTAFQFRGVFGTHTHRHTVGTPILPVWRVWDAGMSVGQQASVALPEYINGRSLNTGLPGRFDAVFLMEPSTSALGWPHRVHRSYRPYQHVVTAWQRVAGATLPAGEANPASTVAFEDLEILNDLSVYVALDTAASAPIAFGTGSATQSSTNPVLDSRQHARVMKHPSGERPREADRVFIGSTLQGAEVPSAVVDEIAFGATTFAGAVGTGTQGGHLVLVTDLAQGATNFTVQTNMVRVALGEHYSANNPVSQLPNNAGLLRIGAEIVCYDSVDAASGQLTIPAGGRGLLGTTEESHEVGESVVVLDAFAVSVLSAAISAQDSTIPLKSPAGFPPQGTVLINGELIHYTRLFGGALEMPRRSSEPGKMDQKAGGMFRGRFGTNPSGHQFGDPVILFPFRYWDRWSDRADAPELAYFGFALDQPSALFKSAFYVQEEPSSGAARIQLLQRLVSHGKPPPPWDGDPLDTPGLRMLSEETDRGDAHMIAAQADRIEWRAHVRYAPGAFDALNGLSHGWKQTPRLRVLGVEYFAPSLVLRRAGE